MNRSKALTTGSHAAVVPCGTVLLFLTDHLEDKEWIKKPYLTD